MDDELISKIVVAVVASVITFILGVIYTTQLQRKQFKLSFKSFLTISLLRMKSDFHVIHKGDSKVRHIISQNYKDIRDYYNNNKKIPVPDLGFISLKNLGPGVILQFKSNAIYFVENTEYRWNVEIDIDVIEKDERVYVCIDDIKAPVGTYYLDRVDIEYKTQANQWIVVCMKYIKEEKTYTVKYQIKSFKILKTKWIDIQIPNGLEWEVPNK